MLLASPPGVMGVWRGRGVVVERVRPEFLEELVRPPPEQHRVDTPDALRGRPGLLLVRGTTQLRFPSTPAKYPSAVSQLNITMRRMGLFSSAVASSAKGNCCKRDAPISDARRS
jgi:hypothetical protein